MGRKAFKPEQIIGELREEEVLLSQGHTVGDVSRKLGATQQPQHIVVGRHGQKLKIACHY